MMRPLPLFLLAAWLFGIAPSTANVFPPSTPAAQKFVPSTNPGLRQWLKETFRRSPFQGFSISAPHVAEKAAAVNWSGPGVAGSVAALRDDAFDQASAPIRARIHALRNACTRARKRFAVGAAEKYRISVSGLPSKGFARFIDLRMQRVTCGDNRFGVEWLNWEPAFQKHTPELPSVLPPPGFLLVAGSTHWTSVDRVLDNLNRAIVAASTPVCRWRGLVPAECRFSHTRVAGGYGAIASNISKIGSSKNWADAEHEFVIVTGRISKHEAEWLAMRNCPGACSIENDLSPGQCAAVAAGFDPWMGSFWFGKVIESTQANAEQDALSSCGNVSHSDNNGPAGEAHLKCRIVAHACNARWSPAAPPPGGHLSRASEAAFNEWTSDEKQKQDVAGTGPAPEPLTPESGRHPDTSGKPPPSAVVDPTIVGHWRLNLPGSGGVVQLHLSIATDGHYDFTSNDPNVMQHSGQFKTRSDRYWSMVSPQWQDGGTYKLLGPNRLLLVGRLGPGTWTRVATASEPPASSTSNAGKAEWFFRSKGKAAGKSCAMYVKFSVGAEMFETMRSHDTHSKSFGKIPVGGGMGLIFHKDFEFIAVDLPYKINPQIILLKPSTLYLDGKLHSLSVAVQGGYSYQKGSTVLDLPLKPKSPLVADLVAAHKAYFVIDKRRYDIPRRHMRQSYDEVQHCLSRMP